MFDLSKAFDTVDHSHLLRKLKTLNLSTSVLKWFSSYLNDRWQATRTPAGTSSWKRVTSGVPQGSILGPLLFNAYMRDISAEILHCTHIKYADDLQIYLHCHPSSLATKIALVHEDIVRIVAWMRAHNLRLNPDKTKTMLLGSARYINDMDLSTIPHITVDGVHVAFSSVVKNLGIYLTPTLNWREQAASMCNQVSKTLYQLRRGSDSLTVRLRAMLIQALVFPILDYCSLVFLDITDVENIRLQRMLNSCVRFVLGVRKSDHITPHYNKLKWLKLKPRRLYFLGTFIFQALKCGKFPWLASSLCSKSLQRTTVLDVRTDPNDLYLPAFRTSVYEHSVLITGIRLWNSLPAPIKGMTSLQGFKSSLFDHLMSLE